ncbi:MAG: GTP 3',8-cyclase MoaA [Candidatus Eisenbacteria bacterium]|nr:GTP 3',8-cyclase MoaA [Candidatus Latescibacterota bacterium]MBD3301597.1 GTP 3',8-cyclase MoaA [Candidatus Eisenbacteria bacterium]
MLQTHGRRVDHLRLSVTDRCGLRCVYCMPFGEPPHAPREEILSFEEMATVVRRLHDEYGLTRVRITGGEPLVRPQLHRLIAQLDRIGLEEISMTTNGQVLARSMDALREAGLSRLNISLDSLDPDRYRRTTGGDLTRTLEGIEAADRSGLRPLKINTVVLRGENEEEIEDLTSWALERGYEIRFLELMAIGCVQDVHANLFVPTREVRERLGRSFALEPLEGEPGAPARIWSAKRDGVEGTVGFISPETEPFCTSCRRLRLTAKGKFLGCIMHDDGPDIRPALRAPGGFDPDAFDAAVRQAVGSKPIDRVYVSWGHMMSIGG